VKLTQAQSLLLQSAIPVAGGVVVTIVSAGYQALTSGHVDTATIGSYLLATGLVALGQALKSYIPAHIPQELQAVKDMQDELVALIQASTQQDKQSTAPRLPVVRPATIAPPQQTNGG